MQKKQIFALWIILALLLALAGCAATAPAKTPAAAQATAEEPAFHAIVDTAFVKQHVQAPMADNVMLIDSRPRRPKYDEGHIPMALSIPDSQFDKMTDKLPADKNALLIFYCGGLQCNLSHKSARKAEALGYKNVKVYAEGYPAWMKVPGHYASVSADWMKQQIDSGADMAVFDSRPRRPKFDEGHLPGAVSLPDSQFEKLKDQLPSDKNKTLVFYCGGLKCPLSHKSAQKAIALGYKQVKVFSEGYPAWTALAGKPETAPAKAVAASGALKTGKREGSIDHGHFKKIMTSNPTEIYLVDVRDKKDYDQGTLSGAVNIPVDDLEGKIASLPADKPVVFICGSGARSGESYYMVKDVRPELTNVYYLDGELTIRKDGTFDLKDPV